MIFWNDIDFVSTLNSPFMALAVIGDDSPSANNGGTGLAYNPPNNINLDALPTELLIKISEHMNPQQRIATAFERPLDYMNINRFHLFTEDAHRQLRIATYEGVTEEQERRRRPLVLDAIAYGFSIDQIAQILDIYEQICIEKQIDRHVFLNSAFPDNRPAHLPPPNPEVQHIRRTVLSPLHVAVQHRRLDVIRYLIERGANLKQAILYPERTPFQYALELASRWWAHFETYSLLRTEEYEQIAIELVQHSVGAAFTDDFQGISLEMHLALQGGLERTAMILLDIFKASNPVLNQAARTSLVNIRNEMLDDVLNSYPEMPGLFGYLLADGARYFAGVSMTTIALEAGRIDMAVYALQSEAQDRAGDEEAYLLSIRAICVCALHDNNARAVQRLVRELAILQDDTSINMILAFAISAHVNSVRIRTWILDNTNSANGSTLRHAICFRHMATTSFIMHRLAASGQSVDDLLLDDSPFVMREENGWVWTQTPLAFALAQENYHAASQLLSVGANPDGVPANIRHRVRKLRDRCRATLIGDAVQFIFKGRQHFQGPEPAPTQAVALDTLNYVFVRMLDDPAHPLPPYVRFGLPQGDLEADHPDNDSEWEDYLIHYETVIALAL
ncbi:hypothetical protein E0Z10_g6877 [Xylaria hypoxylon]|uniref:Uncharacterized protein n=1 Tax=Xylaria hypoxylon TaxID=37992 RepID=A0A4Z0YCG2_9PEZI|nr:hypothetical protein E0Z10_g6877 [Xylaria hypoxylon]